MVTKVLLEFHVIWERVPAHLAAVKVTTLATPMVTLEADVAETGHLVLDVDDMKSLPDITINLVEGVAKEVVRPLVEVEVTLTISKERHLLEREMISRLPLLHDSESRSEHVCVIKEGEIGSACCIHDLLVATKEIHGITHHVIGNRDDDSGEAQA